MRERLRKVAELALLDWVVFLRQQPDVVAQREQPLKQFARLLHPPDERVIVCEPKAAGEKGALARTQTIRPASGVVPQHETVLHELALDRGDGATHSRVVRRQESDQRDKENARIERRRAVRLDERVLRRVKAMLANAGVDFAARPTPALNRAVQFELLDRSNRSIEGDPGHHLRVREIPPAAPHLPNSFVGIAPDLFEMFE